MPAIGIGNRPTAPMVRGGASSAPSAPPMTYGGGGQGASGGWINANNGAAMPQGAAPGAPPVAPAAAAPAAPQVAVPQITVPSQATHSATPNPDLAEYLQRVKTRLDNPGNDTRALNAMGAAVGQFAEGQRGQTRGDFARRGVLGVAGSEQQAMGEIGNQAQANFAKGAEGIALQRARDEDSLLMGAQGAFAAPGQHGLADRQLGIAASGQQGQLAMQGASLNLQAQLANQQAAQQQGNQNFQQQLAAAQMAQQQQLAMAQIAANLYR